MKIEDYLSDNRTEYLAQEYKKCEEEIKSLEKLVQDGMDDLVEEERKELKEKMEMYLSQMENIVKEDEKKSASPKEVILEVRAGAGGDEASIFARDLSNMYQKYSDIQGWTFLTNNISKNEVDGYKEGSFHIKGNGVYDALKYETGVHRVQRVPTTEKSGRIHTSTASVAVLPMKKNTDIKLDQKDIKMEFSRSGGAGGQNVNKVESAVRMLHVPTGLEVRCTEERTQLKNREKAFAILSAKVEEHIKRQEKEKYADIRKKQIGTGDRSEKIRTYNILQDRITDHRIKKNWSNVEGILSGNIQGMVDSLQTAESELENS